MVGFNRIDNAHTKFRRALDTLITTCRSAQTMADSSAPHNTVRNGAPGGTKRDNPLLKRTVRERV